MNDLPAVESDLHIILAKSDPPESLVTHTGYVLSRLADQQRLRPRLAEMVERPRLWHWLYWGTFLHDFGKAADGFQAMLRAKGRTRWGYRHEALSLAFVDWLFPNDHPDRPYVIAVIACHHRDAEVIIGAYQRNRLSPDQDRAAELIAQVQVDNARRLYRWLADYSRSWADRLGFSNHIEIPTMLPMETALKQLTPSAIHRAITELNHFVGPLHFDRDARAALTGSLLRGLILTADHAGSAHTAAFMPASLHRSAVVDAVKSRPFFPHQLAAEGAPPGSVLLISPTSSGKTEAALLWTARQQVDDGMPAPRLFYLLPYQASMNAAYIRLQTIFDAQAVGLQHSRVAQVLFASALADQMNTDAAAAFAYQQKALAQLLSLPVTVMSPYQLLKIPYQLKGFEALLTNFYGGRFILDEIHAYEPKRLALIIAVMAFLRQHCQVRFFIMTATLPPQVRERLHHALPGLGVVQADSATFKQFERHRVHLLSGDLLATETIDRIVANVTAGESVLVCCNTVRRAFEVHAVLESRLRELDADGETLELILLHSRFNGYDRSRKEAAILERTGVNSAGRKQTLVVATQVVEVSLNIDLDTLYTEAAPLEALLQRFGRVNRGRPIGTPPADVYIVRQQPDNVRHIYSHDLIDAALICLEEVDGQPIDESRVNEWLARVYSGAALERWQTDYETSAIAFHKEVMAGLRPFCASHLDKLFYQMFDSIDVVPMQHLQQYEQKIRQGNYLEAAGWHISMAYRDYARLERERLAWQEMLQDNYSVFVVSVPYSPDSGLDIFSVYAPNPPYSPPTTPLDDYVVPEEAD
jgi:CRISPR-associated endonuclease/helicase Cas3